MALKPGDNYCVRAEFEAEDKAARADYFAGTMTHQAYYMRIAESIGLRGLVAVVEGIEPDRAKLRAYLEGDRHLNNIPLDTWDRRHGTVTRMAHRCATPWRVWTLSDSVCILKAVARHMVEGGDDA